MRVIQGLHSLISGGSEASSGRPVFKNEAANPVFLLADTIVASVGAKKARRLSGFGAALVLVVASDIPPFILAVLKREYTRGYYNPYEGLFL